MCSKIFNKLNQLAYYYLYRFSFLYLSRTVRFNRPFRIDGMEYISVNDRACFQKGLWIFCCPLDKITPRLLIGKGCGFGYNNHITCVRNVTIGDFVLTANNVYISDNLHEYENIHVPIMKQPVKFKRAVVIGDGAWIGENVSIIGASIGKNSVVGANSVVTKDIPDYSVAVGSPAIVIRHFDLCKKTWIKTTKQDLQIE